MISPIIEKENYFRTVKNIKNTWRGKLTLAEYREGAIDCLLEQQEYARTKAKADKIGVRLDAWTR